MIAYLTFSFCCLYADAISNEECPGLDEEADFLSLMQTMLTHKHSPHSQVVFNGSVQNVSVGHPSSVLQASSHTTIQDWSKGDWIFILVAALAVPAFAILGKAMIDEYDAKATVFTPPWYCNRQVLFSVGLCAIGGWLAVGIISFTHFVEFGDDNRSLSLAEAVYLCSQIITTVGYGDLTPSRNHGQLFMCGYILVGVTIVAAVLGELLNYAMDYSSKHALEEATESAQEHAIADQNHIKILKETFLHFVLAVLMGTLFFWLNPSEGKTLWQALYMSCVTLTTVGFGAFHPVSEAGFYFASIWMVIGVGITARLICAIGCIVFKKQKALTANLLGAELLHRMDKDKDGRVDKLEFLRFELVRTGVCEVRDIDRVLKRFDVLDRDGNGCLDIQDLAGELEHIEPRLASIKHPHENAAALRT
jgi:potassium channel subfamily K